MGQSIDTTLKKRNSCWNSPAECNEHNLKQYIHYIPKIEEILNVQITQKL